MKIAGNIKKNQDKDGMLRRSLERIIQLYTDKSHFVYELLQNAEDAEATSVKFIQYDDRLELYHNGKPFTEKNLQGLCDIGQSDKINNLNQIGEFGVGFKSVFGICEVVRLYSSPSKYKGKMDEDVVPFAVEIQDFVNPEDIDYIDIDGEYTTKFVFPYCVNQSFSGYKSITSLKVAISSRLQDLGITTLLFMKNLEDIDYEINLDGESKRGSYLLDKKVINGHCAVISALGETTNKNEEISYLKFTRPLEGCPGRTVDIAFSFKTNEDGSWDFVPCGHPYISVYFPTETESKLKFIAQGPYRTTPNRGSIPTDDEDNIDIANKTVSLLRDSILELRDSKKLNQSFINILPIKEEKVYVYYRQISNKNSPSSLLLSPMFEMFKQLCKNSAILPCKNGGYATANQSKIARNEKLADLINDELLTKLISDGIQYKWLPTNITETNDKNKELFSFLTKELSVEVIRPESLARLFKQNPKFLPAMTDEWVVDLYHVFESFEAAFSKTGALSSSDIIKTSTGKFVAPYRRKDSKSIVHNVFLPSSNVNTDVNFVDKDIYMKCRNFFDNILSLTKPDEYEFFINDLKRRFNANEAFNEEQHIKDIKSLLKYLDYPNHCSEVREIIKNYVVLVCKKSDERIFAKPGAVKIFYPISNDINIEGYYRHIVDNYYIDIDFYECNGIEITQLSKFEVTDSILLNQDTVGGTYESYKDGRLSSWRAIGDFRRRLTLDKINNVLIYISTHPNAKDSVIKSVTIWKTLLNNEIKISGSINVSGKILRENSDIIKLLTGESFCGGWNGKWLFTEEDELVSQKTISKYDMSTAYYGKIKQDSSIYEILNFKKTDKDKLDIATKEYDKLSEETRALYFEIELKRRGITSDALNENHVAPGYVTVSDEEDKIYEFPTAKVKNWELLRKHAAETLCYANPTKYEMKLRSIRVSNHPAETRAYLFNTYRYPYVHKYACQMCHEPTSEIKAIELFFKPEKELDPVHLCLCPNCAAKYDKLRHNSNKMELLRNNIISRKESEIDGDSYIAVRVDDYELWFTQTHFAEIQLLLKYQEQVEKKSANSSSIEVINEDDVDTVSGLDVYKEYEGKYIKFKKGDKGKIVKCEGSKFFIQIEGQSQIKEYSMEICLANKTFEIIE